MIILEYLAWVVFVFILWLAAGCLMVWGFSKLPREKDDNDGQI
jgi:hypothetical protein